MDKVGFLIDSQIEFWPEENVLYSRTLGIECKIFSTASRCLEYLLQCQGELVLQHTLFIAGWGPEYASEIKPNTLYQNIMEIRRKLKQVGLDKPFLETIPRKGWRVLAEVQLEPLVSIHGLPFIPMGNSLILSENPEGNDTAKTPDLDKPAMPSVSGPRKIPESLSWLMVMIAVPLCIGTFLLYQHFTHQSERYFAEYEAVNSGGHCKLFTGTPFLTADSYMNYQQYYRPRCDDNRSIYLTYNEQRVSVISCSVIKSGEKNCITDLYILRK